MSTRVLIVDDHPAAREGLSVRIGSQPDLEVCGEAADVGDALQVFDATGPDVVVVDIQLKTGDGLDLIKRLKARDEDARILVWSVYDDKIYAERALKAGALGYINKQHTTGHIVDAVRRVAAGKVYLGEEIAELLLKHAVGGSENLERSPVESLSDRELEVFRLIGEGLSTAEVAGRLHLSRHTVETHRQRIKEKFDVATGSELTHIAIRWVLEEG